MFLKPLSHVTEGSHTMAMSESKRVREMGKQHYLRACAEGIAPVLLHSRLQDALSEFQRALTVPGSDADYASAHKNLYMTRWKLFRLSTDNNDESNALHNCMEAVKALNDAYQQGKDTMTFSWLQDLRERSAMLIQETVASWDRDTLERLVYKLRGINLQLFPDIQGIMAFAMLEDMFHDGIRSLADSDFRKALRLFDGASEPLVMLEQALASPYELLDRARLATEYSVYQTDVHLQQCVARSAQQLHLGKVCYESAVHGDETIDMRKIFLALDHFKQAGVLCHGVDIEHEAIANSYLGQIWTKIFKMTVKGKSLCQLSMTMAFSMHPRTFDNKEWFKAAWRVVEAYQKEQEKRDDEATQREKEPYLEELHDELEAIKTKRFDSSTAELLKFIYENHPPKKEGHTLEEPVESNEKNRLKKAMIHYHPDQQSQHDRKWQVLCEEIMKTITSIYETFK